LTNREATPILLGLALHGWRNSSGKLGDIRRDPARLGRTYAGRHKSSAQTLRLPFGTNHSEEGFG
jgi:hypothetical protein